MRVRGCSLAQNPLEEANSAAGPIDWFAVWPEKKLSLRKKKLLLIGTSGKDVVNSRELM